MKNLKLIKGVETTPLKKLNEAKNLKNPDKYVFQGVFTQCSTPEHKIINRNNRLYMESEVLRHIGYLREMIKENNGRLLGELDHPEGRFDIQMKEASHMITDLWYDDNTKCVMGRLEVLDTPNGKTLKSLIDAGFPLYVSSRAAGDVNEKTKEVEIAQIFTYDVVCTPGFKEARLERVDESLLSPKALKYLNESVSNAEKANAKDITVPASKINESLISKFRNTTVADVITPLNEDEEVSMEAEMNKTDGKEALNDMKKYYPVMGSVGNSSTTNSSINSDEVLNEKDKEEDADKTEQTSDNKEDNNDDSKKEEKEIKPLSDSEKEENRELILSIVGLDNNGDTIGNSGEDEDKSDKDEKKDDIENIEGVKKDEEEDDTKEDEETSESVKKEDKKSKALKKDTDDTLKELDSILDSVNKAEEVKESIVRRYPFSISLSESNFSKFAALRPKQKKRCAEFIEEHNIFNINAINELWMTPLREDKKLQQNWLKLASQSDIDLYVKAPIEVQNAIEEQAQLFILESQEDVDNFWNNTGLRQAAYRKALNEEMVNNYKRAFENRDENKERMNAQVGYDMDAFIQMTENLLR